MEFLLSFSQMLVRLRTFAIQQPSYIFSQRDCVLKEDRGMGRALVQNSYARWSGTKPVASLVCRVNAATRAALQLGDTRALSDFKIDP